MRARNAILPDAVAIESLIAEHIADGTLLPRSIADICENIRDFIIVEEDEGKIIGCGALHLYGPHLAEIRSITVQRSREGNGGGRLLVQALLREAERHQVTCLCLFTRIPKFFAQMGFTVADRARIPDKLYKDCQHCPRQHACDEIAMVRGELPSFAILAPGTSASHLAQLSISR